uniref:Histone deacetylase complex subunit SAP18 n=1 Tax=Panagrolaimus sp. ES5 TaxID=591445 RepID=A0AC34GS31_9BILA
MHSNVISEVDSKADKVIDREKVCPLLLRIFVTNMRHNPIQEYKGGSVPQHNELQIYTWMDCTLRELMFCIKDVNIDSRRKGTTFDFAIVTPDFRSNRMNFKSVGITTHGFKGVDDNKTLASCKFQIGDYIDVAITPAAIVPNRGRHGDFQRGSDFQRGGDFSRGGGDYSRGDFPPRRSNEGPGRRFDRFNSNNDRRYRD